MFTRRRFLQAGAGLFGGGFALGAYGGIIEPDFMLTTRHYAFTPPRWTSGLKLRLVVLTDVHCVEPFMPIARFQMIIARAMALEGDVVLLLGDFTASLHIRSGIVPVGDIARAARSLSAPLGVYAVNGNHDWWTDRQAQRAGHGPPAMQRALEDAGIDVLANRARRLAKDGLPFWVTGTDSMIAIYKGPGRFEGLDDIPGTLAQVSDDAPVIHLAHEPDLFVDMPARVSLTLSGHTHGGQVRILGYSPYVPSAYGNRFAYGHVVEDGRHLCVSGGLGCSVLPVRFGVPPEIVVIDLG
jgi:uncharacterized protein